MDSDAPTRRVGAPPGDPAAEPPLSRGDFVGRYLVVDRLGEGGMGFVYRGYDPELDRHVALKVLRPAEPGSEASQSSGRDRLLREAQAMARISHPNIVKVHDVGPIDDEVFLAMDLIEGTDAKTWLRAQQRPWREVLRVFVLAGRGLAAAHSVGLIHRDFKPENVLIDGSGDVFVTDFGLARLAGAGEPIETTLDRHDTPGSDEKLATSLTRTGTVVGTPAYMAPEQHAGGEADARSDQFGFCVALYEGLYGERPYAGDSLSDVVSAKMRSRIREAPRDARVPAWLRKIVLRGLRVDLGQRYLSMHALLRELERRPRIIRRRIVAGVAVASLALVVGLGQLVVSRRHDTLCAGAEHAFAGIWDGPRQQAIARRFEAAGVPYGTAAWETTRRVLDEDASAWRAMRTQTCEATRLLGEQSEELMTLRMRCLDRHLAHLRGLSDVLVDADADTVLAAPRAVHGLDSLARCADGEALAGVGRAEADPETAARADRLAAELAAARARADLGQPEPARAVAEQTVRDAQALGDRVLEAEALLLLGELQGRARDDERAEQTLYRSVWRAEAGRADDVGARAWVGIVELSAAAPRPGHEDAARHAAHAIGRSGGDDPELRARLEAALGRIHAAAGDHDTAREHHARALALREQAHGARHPAVADSLRALGDASVAAGEPDRAVALQVRALAIAEDVYGSDHPQTAAFVRSLGGALERQGKRDEARAHRERAQRIEAGGG